MTWKRQIRRILNRFGYDVVRCYGGEGSSLYMPCTPYHYRTYAPWFSSEFRALYKNVAGTTVVKEDRCYVLHRLAMHCSRLSGNIAECGVFKGGTAFVIADAVKRTTKRVRLFDTFSGMPESAAHDPSGHAVGEFGDTSLESVQAYLAGFPSVEYFSGTIPESFSHVEADMYCLVHVDVDLYQSVYDSCAYFYPRLVDGGAMVFDDYGFEKYVDSAKKAVDDFFSNKPEVLLPIRTGQCVVFKLPVVPSPIAPPCP